MTTVTGKYGDTTLQQVFEQLRQSVEIKDRRWLGFTYSACADAVEMVDFLSKQSYCGTRVKAVAICLELQKQGAITHVWGSKKFKFTDMQMFFRFSDSPQEEVADAYDLVVIGGGTAGISATSFAASFGAKCVMLEANRVGGDCTWSGCVPSKSLIHAAHTVHDAKKAQEQFGVGVTNHCADMSKVKAYVWDKIHTIAKHDIHLLEDKNVPVRYGMARFVDAHTLDFVSREGEKHKIKSRAFILCLGAVPAPPPIKGLDSVRYHTYETIFDVDALPKHMCVVGGGVIGCELAQCFARFGAKVTLVADRLLPKEPEKVDALLSEQFEKEGIIILRGRASSVEKMDPEGKTLKLTVSSKTSAAFVEADMLLVATGRRPNTSEINLAAAGVQVDAKTKLITVDSGLRTTANHIYAAGDCCTLQQFTHYASLMGIWAARNLLLPGSTIPTHVVPRATFTFPEVASVGLTEAEAREKGFEIVSQPASHNERAVCEDDKLGFIDVYIDKSGYIKGACIMNGRAGELLSEILIAMEKKFPFTDLSLTGVVHPYPSYSWATSMLATEVAGKRIQDGLTGTIIRWAVSKS
jgi:pyruvate/2-oxoglutarate dehydrogenase complex dihydrolipoamide dehydrogenase (E3) component